MHAVVQLVFVVGIPNQSVWCHVLASICHSSTEALSFPICLALSSPICFVVFMATSVVETIVRLKFGPSALLAAFTSKPQAIRWFKNWLIAQDQRLQQCMVLRTVAMERNGWGLKVRFDRMAEDALEDSIASLRQLVGQAGTVIVLTDEEVALEIVQRNFQIDTDAPGECCGKLRKDIFSCCPAWAAYW